METTDFSDSPGIKTTGFILKISGFWIWKDRREKLMMDLLTGYSILAICFAAAITSTDVWFSRNNFFDVAFAALNTMTVFVISIKLANFTIKRVAFLNLIKFCYENFWKGNYDSHEKRIMQECEKRSAMFVKSFVFVGHGTLLIYALRPILENLGKSDSERSLPFNIWLDIPKTITPYYEILFLIEVFALYHTGICYFCFDNFLCLVNIHIAGQFRMLQRRLELVCSRIDRGESPDEGKDSSIDRSSGYVAWNFEDCIRHHQTLIGFVESIEDMFTLVILCQVVIFSLLACFSGYLVIMGDGHNASRSIFVGYSISLLIQLFAFTLSCDDLMRESEAVGDGAYRARWYRPRTNDSAARTLVKDLMFVISRSRRPCCLTAGGFAVITLETFRAILSTAMSYLTLLRNRQQN